MIPDLRKKLLFTLLIIIVFRIGSVIPVPFIDTQALQNAMEHTVNSGESSNMIGYLDTISGGAFSNATIFAMGITPYINSSIIIQLLCVAIPALERLSKEGEAGRKKIGAITRYVTVALGLIQGTAYFFYLKNSGITSYNSGFEIIFTAIVIVLVFTAGTALMMWLGEQINKFGVGNGISILLFAGIIARLPKTVYYISEYWKQALGTGEAGEANPIKFVWIILWVVLFLGVVWLITFMQDSERRIPIQYAKRVVGRKMYGGQSSHLPIKVALGGVLPIIFASSILSPVRRRGKRLLERLCRRVQSEQLAVHRIILHSYFDVCLFLHYYSVQPHRNGKQPQIKQRYGSRHSSGRAHCGLHQEDSLQNHPHRRAVPFGNRDFPARLLQADRPRTAFTQRHIHHHYRRRRA